MSEQETQNDDQPPAAPPGPISLAEFLESVPPSQEMAVCEAVVGKSGSQSYYYQLASPEIRLHCSNDNCNGIRFWRAFEGTHVIRADSRNNFYVTYICSNCRRSLKTFALRVVSADPSEGSALCYKYGEYPHYGPPTPSRLISLIGPDREIFLKGRRCENQGLGIGAFVYYRRVVENQKNRIIENIIKVSEKLSVSPEIIAALKAAQGETQFSRAVDSIKNALPQSLLIDGHNPLTLLHSALSEGLHAQTDERCLEIAHDIRVVLGELSERLGQALKDDKELHEALSRLMSKPAAEA